MFAIFRKRAGKLLAEMEPLRKNERNSART